MNSIGITVVAKDRPGLLRDVATCIASVGGNIDSVNNNSGVQAEVHLEISNIDDQDALRAAIMQVEGVESFEIAASFGSIFGKRVIVMGGGAQVAQVVLGAVSEADRHNIRGERISVDTIPIVGEHTLADAVRAVARLPRAKILVLAGSIMGGEITQAVRELRNVHGIPVISLAMVGSVVDEVDLVITDPVQAGVMSVMAIANTAAFTLDRLKQRKL